MTGVVGLCGILAALLVFGAGCESTIDQARKIAATGELAMHQQGLTVARVDRQIHVVSTAIVHDANGTAVVVELRNTTHAALVDAPITIDVTDATGKSVFKNNAPGLELDLTHVPLLPPGQLVTWVNDQVLASGTPAHVAVRVGGGRRTPAALPRIQLSGVQLTDDPTSGYAATGRVRNNSAISQVQLVLFATARRAGRIVAAGRAVIPRLAAGKATTFHAYFIGNPTGAQLSVSAPPSVLP